MRTILHSDLNNFYASVECMLDPTLKKYPGGGDEFELTMPTGLLTLA